MSTSSLALFCSLVTSADSFLWQSSSENLEEGDDLFVFDFPSKDAPPKTRNSL